MSRKRRCSRPAAGCDGRGSKRGFEPSGPNAERKLDGRQVGIPRLVCCQHNGAATVEVKRVPVQMLRAADHAEPDRKPSVAMPGISVGQVDAATMLKWADIAGLVPLDGAKMLS